MSTSRDRQVGGTHYAQLTIQPWDVLPEWLEGWSPYQAYLVGNAVKYLARAPRKGARLDDARKARHYLDELIRTLEEVPDEMFGEPELDPKFDIRPADTRDIYP